MFILNKQIFYAIFLLLSIALVMAPGQQDVTDDVTADKGGIANKDISVGNDQANGTGSGSQVETETALKNAGEETQNKVTTQTMIQSGEYIAENGQNIQLQTKENNQVELKTGNAVAKTSMQMTQEKVGDKTALKVQLSNGVNAEVKVMPDAASTTALERLGLKSCTAEEGCTIELKEVGKGETAEPAYEVEAETEGKFLGLFKVKAKVKTQVSAESGEILRVKKPFLTSVKTVETTTE